MEGNTHDEVGLRLLHGGKVDDHNAVDHHHAAHHAVKEKANNLISCVILDLSLGFKESYSHDSHAV